MSAIHQEARPGRTRATRRRLGARAVRRLTLDDGSTVDVRPIEPGDRAELAAAFARLRPESRRRRFGVPKPRLSDAELTFLTDVDHHCHEALVALEPVTGRGVAVARYVVFAREPGTADVAVTVDDEWQGLGLGKALSGLLVKRAEAEGVERLRATVGGDNKHALGLARRAGYEVAGVSSGSVEFERRVSSSAPGLPRPTSGG